MAQFFEALTEEIERLIAEQTIFFVATAPAEGRINLSPKGMDTFRCLDSKTVAYLDLTGSGNETAAHLRENDRVTLMFCSFSRKPLILRLYGRGRAVMPGDAEWAALYARFEPLPGVRQIFVIDLETAQTSCGYGVPVFTGQEERPTLRKWAEHKGEDGIAAYQREKNRRSIDGLETGIEG